MAAYHACLDVRGALKSFKASQLASLFKREDGSRMPANEAREHLFDQLAMGREVIPFGACDNFDFKNGCQGHPAQEEPA